MTDMNTNIDKNFDKNIILRSEINERRRKLLELIRDNACIIMTKPANIFYYSGFLTDTGMLVYDGSWHMLTDSRYTLKASEELIDTELIGIDHDHSYIDVLGDLITLGVAYIEKNDMNVSFFDKLNSALDNIYFAGADDLIEAPRRIKSEYELTLMKKAAGIGDAALLKVIPLIKPGISESEIAGELEYQMKKMGAAKTSFDTIALCGPDTAMPHGTPGTRKVANGDLVTMDFGCVYEGYCSDMTRTIAVGSISDEMKKVYDTVLDAQNKAFEAIHASVIGSSIDKIARDHISNMGYDGYFGHGLGHSLGIEIHENPNFNMSETSIIEENMVLSVEPGIYIPHKFGVRIEDVIIVKKSGYINLTSSSKKLYHL